MFQTRAIVLKKNPIYEVDNLVTVYSEDFGKIKLIARGSQKIVSKLSAHLESINLIFLEFVYGKNFKIITSAQIKDNFESIRSNFNKIKLIFEVFEYIDKCLSFEEKDLDFWQFLFNFLKKVEKKNDLDIKKSNIFKIYFLVNFLNFLGFLPDLNQCVKCGNLEFINIYLVAGQGLLCDNCYKNEKSLDSLNKKEINLLKKFLNTPGLYKEKINIDLSFFKKINFSKIRKILEKFLFENAIN